jgi:hypothetical protein
MDAYQEQAKQYAITDAGLTESEAERAVWDYLPQIDNSDYCQDCGCKLSRDNTESVADEICSSCWAKCEAFLAQLT